MGIIITAIVSAIAGAIAQYVIKEVLHPTSTAVVQKITGVPVSSAPSAPKNIESTITYNGFRKIGGGYTAKFVRTPVENGELYTSSNYGRGDY